MLFTSVIPSETLLIASEFNGHVVEFNGHVVQQKQGFNWRHGGCGYGTHSQERTRVLDFCAAPDLVLRSIFLRKSHS